MKYFMIKSVIFSLYACSYGRPLLSPSNWTINFPPPAVSDIIASLFFSFFSSFIASFAFSKEEEDLKFRKALKEKTRDCFLRKCRRQKPESHPFPHSSGEGRKRKREREVRRVPEFKLVSLPPLRLQFQPAAAEAAEAAEAAVVDQSDRCGVL